jgi:uncharacterized protein YprB with RNaseH-like and TPR domain
MTAAVALDRMRHAVRARGGTSPPASNLDALAVSNRSMNPALAQILRGEWHDTAHGAVFVCDEWLPLEHEHGALALRSALNADRRALSLLLGSAAPELSRLAFFDIETTGLAGGTGTYVVIAGLGSYERAAAGEPLAFRMRQYFLADIAGERAMLAMLGDDLRRFDGLVTYNGRTFDVPFVETRLTLSRLPSPYPDLAHFDLLHPVRRLYRHRMPSCRLADAERRLLRVERPDDVPGSLIPQLYFDYLRAGRIAPLRGVMRHNADDVLSLVGVLARLAALFTDERLDPEDAVAVARWWEREGEEGVASALYRDALPWLQGGGDWQWAAARHARLCRRSGARDEASALWGELWAAGDRAAGLELAKHLEHHSRDLAAAERVTRGLLAGASDAERMTLTARMERLRRNQARRAAAAAA